jgi:hypothetical protein
VLESTGVHERCTLGLHIELRSSTEEVHQFDTESALWKKKISPIVQWIWLSCATDAPWCQDVLKSVPNVERFTAVIHDDAMKFRSRSGQTFHWSQLRHIQFNDIWFEESDFVAFLKLHLDIIAQLELQRAWIGYGDWMEPLQVMGQMPKLEILNLWDLHAKLLAVSPITIFDIYSPGDWDNFAWCALRLSGTAVRLALDVLVGELRMTDSDELDDRTWVDCRKAQAAVDGKLEWDGTVWKLKSQPAGRLG